MRRQLSVHAFALVALVCSAAVLAGDGSSAFNRDRDAILSLAGAFEVEFNFHETFGVSAGYTLAEPKLSRAIELVTVAEDRGGFISLQHVLVTGTESGGTPRVVKHWRQDWTFEDTRVMEYRGGRTWDLIEVNSTDVEGTWTQAVFQTNDSPRYEAIGTWKHIGEQSAWQSRETWRPLPRREYTTRDDYDVIVGTNRHTVTPAGWFHEQDSQKVVLDQAGRPLAVVAHEVGINSYVRTDPSRLTAASEYWDKTKGSWAELRAAWDSLLDVPGEVEVHLDIEGRKLNTLVGRLVRAEDLTAGDMAGRLAMFVERD
ncbi:MAG: DUF6607 family protein [Planctomycetota bacterium]